MQKITYSESRNLMQSGDAILWQANGGIIPSLIQWWAPDAINDMSGEIVRISPNHASLIVRMNDYVRNHEVFIAEALSEGLVPRILSRRIEEYDGRIFWLQTDMTDEQRFLSREIALLYSAMGIKYDLKDLFKNALGKVNVDLRRLFCSEWLQVNWTDCEFIEKRKKAMRPWDLIRFGIVWEIVE